MSNPSKPAGKVESSLAVLREIIERVETTMMSEFQEVKAKQDKTNGNVTDLRVWREGHISQHNTMKWIIAILVVPILLIFVKVYVEGQ